jgi:hypothetical protein
MPTTCGQGLAQRAPLPAKLAALIGALAHNLELHKGTLDTSDPNSKQELDAYAKLERAYRTIAAELRSAAEQMAGYRDLPMGKHDVRRLADPKLVDAFDAFVTRERETLELVQIFLERDEMMLGAMQTAESAPMN